MMQLGYDGGQHISSSVAAAFSDLSVVFVRSGIFHVRSLCSHFYVRY